jgi:hypothetical protein
VRFAQQHLRVPEFIMLWLLAKDDGLVCAWFSVDRSHCQNAPLVHIVNLPIYTIKGQMSVSQSVYARNSRTIVLHTRRSGVTGGRMSGGV